MEKVQCESCHCTFNRDKAVEKFDEKYGDGTYEYLYQWNDFCFECAIEIYEENHGNNGEYSNGFICCNCQQSLSKGALTLPWEDGNNPNAYIVCPCCGKKI